MIRDFDCLDDALAVMPNLVNEVASQGYTAFLSSRALARKEIIPAITGACRSANLSPCHYDAPNPTYDVSIVTTDIDATRFAVEQEIENAISIGII